MSAEPNSEKEVAPAQGNIHAPGPEKEPMPAQVAQETAEETLPIEEVPLEDPQKGRWERSWPTITCGAGLFSDGYLNGVCSLTLQSRSMPECPFLTPL